VSSASKSITTTPHRTVEAYVLNQTALDKYGDGGGLSIRQRIGRSYGRIKSVVVNHSHLARCRAFL